MSVVVGYISGDRVIMGCDSQVSIGYNKHALTNRNNFKIFKPTKNNDVLIGLCGNLRDLNLLYCVEEYIEELANYKDIVDFKYIVTKVVPKIFEILKDMLIEDGNKIKYMSSILLFAYKNQLYEIGHYGEVTQIDNFCAIGSGEELAEGYLNCCTDIKDEDKVISSIASACKSSLYVGLPIKIMNTQNDEIETFIN